MANILEPYKNVIGATAGVASMLQYCTAAVSILHGCGFVAQLRQHRGQRKGGVQIWHDHDRDGVDTFDDTAKGHCANNSGKERFRNTVHHHIHVHDCVDALDDLLHRHFEHIHDSTKLSRPADMCDSNRAMFRVSG